MTTPVSTRDDAEPKPARTRSQESRERVVTRANAALAVFAFGGGLAGWQLSPTLPSPPGVPETPEVTVSLNPVPSDLQIVASLVGLRGDAARLTVTVSGLLRPPTPRLASIIDFTGLTGYVCAAQGSHAPGRTLKTANGSWLVENQSPVPVDGLAVVNVNVCWQHSAPISVHGPYFSAALPRVTDSSDPPAAGLAGKKLTHNKVPAQSGSLIRSLTLYRLVDYSDQGPAPTTETGSRWFWAGQLSQALGNPSASSIPVVASNLIALRQDAQRDDEDQFLAGIVLGTAAGALVTLVTGVLTVRDDTSPWKRRRLRRKKRATSVAAAAQPTSVHRP